ncbi:hypothetical protein [Ruania albidiflava]|uniref:hypothetical protein n=1 Tax=Ruania albidiflava TaxID=366586 RepID=UPI0003B6A549|nr:hypothetical protein [Ruania albidiflava]
MPLSPKGREIKYVEGSPSEIESRGATIKSLGDQMIESAELLEKVKSRALDGESQKGKAIEKLRESIGDSHEILKQAGELYQPVGPVIETYGNKLAVAQILIEVYVDQAESRWETFASLPGYVDPRGTGGIFQPEEGSEEAEQNAEEDAAKKAAYEEWEESAENFDRWYGDPGNEDSWEVIFEEAVDGITEEMADKIKDSFWDAIGDFLSIAALVLGVVALFVGGWVIAAIALAVAVAYLAVTIIQYNLGEKSGMDIFFAALGVLPVGKLSNMTKLLHGSRGLKAFGNGALGKFADLKRANGLQKLDGKFFKEKAFTFNGKGGFKKAAMGSEGPKAVHREHMKLYFGPGGREAFIGGQNAIRNLSRVDFGLQFAGNISTWSGRVGSVTDWNDPSPKWMGALL